MPRISKYNQYFDRFEQFLSRNFVALTYLKNFTGQRDGTGRPGKRQKLVPGQTFGKSREIAVTIYEVLLEQIAPLFSDRFAIFRGAHEF